MLSEDRDSQHCGDRGIDVGDHRGAHGADLRDQREEEEECDCGAHDGEPENGPDHLSRGHLLGKAESCDRQVHDGGDRERGRDHAERGQIGQPAQQDHGADGVADCDQPDLADRKRSGAFEIQSDDGADTGQPDEEPEQTLHAEPRAVAGRSGDDRADQGHGGEQQRGQRAGDLLLGGPQQDPGQGDLDSREGKDGHPVADEWPELVPRDRNGNQEQRRDARAGQHERRRAQVAETATRIRS